MESAYAKCMMWRVLEHGCSGKPFGDGFRGMQGAESYNFVFLREGPCSQGASWAVCGSGVPPNDFLNLYVVFDSRFCVRNGWDTARLETTPGVDGGEGAVDPGVAAAQPPSTPWDSLGRAVLQKKI
jgi:hypothetical protein